MQTTAICTIPSKLPYAEPAFLTLRDKLPEFTTAKESGAVGIPAILTEDGTVTLDWEGWLAERGQAVVYKENGPVCSIDGKGC